MVFNSLSYLFFFPFTVLLYFALPWQRARNAFLLFASYFFYMCWNPTYIVLLFGCTLITYTDGLFIDIAKKEKEQNIEKQLRHTGPKIVYVIITLITVIAVLAWFKYANFLTGSFVAVLKMFGVVVHIPRVDVLLPIGISFYTFQALSYVIDVYRGTISAERNFFRYMLFISFFPQNAAGPIGRAGKLLDQFNHKHSFDIERVSKGLMMMLWGYFIKVVIADRLAILIDQVFNYYTAYEGLIPIIATVFFGIQIYCDFAGYTNIAIGSAQILGFELTQNFEQPYLATSVADFWRRWHISLTSWFRDYIYIPLGGSRKGKKRQYFNILFVFLVSGLWHGAAWTYVLWGGMNGIYQIIGSILKPLREKILCFMHINTNSMGHRLVQRIITFIFVDFAWLFFRAHTISAAFGMIRQSFRIFNPWVLFDGTIYSLGLDAINFWITLCAIMVLFIVDVLHEKEIHIRDRILRQPLPVRWGLYYAAGLAIIIFGVYGPAYNAGSFIYFQF